MYFHAYFPNISQWFNNNIANAICPLGHAPTGAKEPVKVIWIVGRVGPEKIIKKKR